LKALPLVFSTVTADAGAASRKPAATVDARVVSMVIVFLLFIGRPQSGIHARNGWIRMT
jgi:hypothetical protein